MATQAQTPSLNVSLTPIKPALRTGSHEPFPVLARLQAPHSTNLPRVPLSIAIVIDRSGSMAGDKLRAAKDCTQALIQQLQDDDEVSVVTYDTEVDVVLPLTAAADAKTRMGHLLSQFDTGGSTDLHAGWLTGAHQLSAQQRSGRVSRVILLSDGQANHGIVNIDSICEQVKQLAQAGVTTSTVGIGLGFNEELMTAMATAGAGNAMYGDSAQDLAEPFEAEIGLLSHLAWSQVRVRMGSASSRWKMLNDYPSAGDQIWQLPDIANASEAWICFSAPMDSVLRAQQRSQRQQALHITVEALDGNGQSHTFTCSLANLPVIDDAAWQAMAADALVHRRVVELRAAELQRQARAAVQQRQWHTVELLLREIEALAAENPWVQQVVVQMRDLLARRDHQRMEKEILYSAARMSRRLTEVDEAAYLDVNAESEKAAYLRKKTYQGRNTR